MYEIQKDVPIPPKSTGTKSRKYPYPNMKVGESFFRPSDKPAYAHRLLHASSSTWAKKNNPKALFTTRSVVENGVTGVRIWRTK